MSPAFAIPPANPSRSFDLPAPPPPLPPGPPKAVVQEAPAAAQFPSLDESNLPPAITTLDGRDYIVQQFRLRYQSVVPGQPDLTEFATLPITLGLTREGYIAPRAGVPLVQIRLGDVFPGSGARFFQSAIGQISLAMLTALQSRQLLGLYVVPDSADIDPGTSQDLRGDRRTLTLVVWTGAVEELRTVASGDRLPADAPRINNPIHQSLKDRSPVQPGGLLRADQLDDYAVRLNRLGGRRVDIAIAPTRQPGRVILDYLVSESRPWALYGQVSNTGTRQTGEWRNRFGFMHSQLTNVDDTFRLDYSTSDFDQTHAVTASYERPFGDGTWKLRPYGSWNKYTAADVGFSGSDFLGEGYSAGVEVEKLLWQDREWFLDAYAGGRYDFNDVDNRAVLIAGNAATFTPYLGARLSRQRDEVATRINLAVEHMSPGFTGVTERELEVLGRASPDNSWTVLRWDAEHSFYLEPLIDPDDFFTNTSEPAEGLPDWKPGQSLAHELAFSTRGQVTADRLIPQAQQVAGGFYSVRGYPESIAAADSVFIATAEYRLHLPRALRPRDPSSTPLFGRPFRFAPPQAYGRADWDLIFRAFVDWGRTITTERRSFEDNQTLLGAGLGVELQFQSNITLRVDWGAALRGVGGNDPVDAGDNRFHIALTILY